MRLRESRAWALALALAITPMTAVAQGAPADAPAALPPIDFGDDDIRDIRGPIELPDPWWITYGPGLLVALAAALAIAGTLVIARRLRREPSPRDVALAQLTDARQRIAAGDPARFGEAVSEAVRRYLEARFALHAPRLTTEEFLAELAADESSPVRAHRTRLGELLAFCDAAKFGGFRLAEEEMDAMESSARRFVEETSRDADASERHARAGSSERAKAEPIETRGAT